MALVGFRVGCFMKVKRTFMDEVIGSYQGSADYNSNTAAYYLRMNVPDCFMSSRSFI